VEGYIARQELIDQCEFHLGAGFDVHGDVIVRRASVLADGGSPLSNISRAHPYRTV